MALLAIHLAASVIHALKLNRLANATRRDPRRDLAASVQGKQGINTDRHAQVLKSARKVDDPGVIG